MSRRSPWSRWAGETPRPSWSAKRMSASSAIMMLCRSCGLIDLVSAIPMNVDRDPTPAQPCELFLNPSDAGVAPVLCYRDLELSSGPSAESILDDRLGGVGREPLGALEDAPEA